MRGNRLALLSAISAALCSGALSGCGMSGVSTGAIAPHLSNIRPEKSGRVFFAAPDPANGTSMKSANGFGIIRDAKVESYLQGIVTRLLDHWHGDKPERVGVFIEAKGGVQAMATPSGDILVPIGAFNGLDNEDQLAALVGHELGHIVLKHHEDEKQARQLAKLGEFAVGAAFFVSSIKNGEMQRNGNMRQFQVTRPGAVRNDTVQAFAIHTAMVTITQDVILSAYAREQEYVADVFGANLSGRAGWDPRALISLTQTWEDAEEAKRLKKNAMAEKAGLVAGVMSGIGEVAASVTGGHPSAEKRRENIATALQTSFANSVPVPPTIEPYQKAVASPEFARKREVWRDVNRANELIQDGRVPEALAMLRALEKRKDADHPESRFVMALAVGSLGTPEAAENAYQLLSTADLRQPATLTFYQQAITAHADRGRWGEAEQTIQVGEKYYGEKMLPERIAVLRMQGRGQQQMPQHLSTQISDLMKRCEASSDEELLKYCKAARTGEDVDADYQACGGIINSLAGLAGQSKCTTADAAKNATSGGSLVTNVVTGIFGGGQ